MSNHESTTNFSFICISCGAELKFFKEQLEQMEYCPYCSASIYTTYKNKYNTVKLVLGHYVNTFGKQLVQNVMHELKLTPRPPFRVISLAPNSSKTNNH